VEDVRFASQSNSPREDADDSERGRNIIIATMRAVLTDRWVLAGLGLLV
jgi:hypothetical protein